MIAKSDAESDMGTLFGMLMQAVRTCPVCRQTSHFVTPSMTWPCSQEEKAAIIDAYKTKLSSIDCRYFDFGGGTCPFSTSCMYRHAYKNGQLAVSIAIVDILETTLKI